MGEVDTLPESAPGEVPLQMVCAPLRVLVALMLLTRIVVLAVAEQPVPPAPVKT